MGFPINRMRRLRGTEAMRRLVRRTRLSVDDLVYPLFVKPGRQLKQPIESMQGCFHFSPDMIAEEARQIADLGIPAILLFGAAEKKDKIGSGAWAEDGAVQQAVRLIKQNVPELLVITDVCLCAYTDTGHCGLVRDGKIQNDKSCELLARIALSHAQAGADMVAPSDMMDGRVKVIRETLDENGYQETPIMSYSAKFASTFYGPFRDVADSTPAFGDRKTYQMDPADSSQALREIQLDLEEGADIVMIKPALAFLDIIRQAADRFDCPIAAYNVSGEYMMLKNAEQAGILEKQQAILEVLSSIKRAGADIIITYFAKEIAGSLK